MYKKEYNLQFYLYSTRTDCKINFISMENFSFFLNVCSKSTIKLKLKYTWLKPHCNLQSLFTIAARPAQACVATVQKMIHQIGFILSIIIYILIFNDLSEPYYLHF